MRSCSCGASPWPACVTSASAGCSAAAASSCWRAFVRPGSPGRRGPAAGSRSPRSSPAPAGRRVQRQHHGVLVVREGLIDARDHGVHVHVRAVAFLPVLQRDEEHGRVRAAAVFAEAADGIHESHGFVLHHVILDFQHQLAGLGLGRALRQDDHGVEAALVFFRQEGRGQAHEQQRHRRDHGGVGQAEAHRARQHAGDARGVAGGQADEGAVEPAEEAALLVVAGRDGPQHGGAQRRRERQRQEGREGDRHRQRDRELTVDIAHRAVEEGHRHEHGHQHHGDADDGAADLAHGLDRGVVRRQAFLGHDALDVLDHHDGVVHQNADGQHHAEHGQHVDRIAQAQHHAQRAQQRHRHHQRGDQRGAEVLHEQVHHAEHQGDGLQQRGDHLLIEISTKVEVS